MYGRFDTAKELIKAGARLDQPDLIGFTPFTLGAWLTPKNHEARSSFFQFLAHNGILEDLSESRLYSGTVALEWARWQDIEFFDMLVAVDSGPGRVLWEDVEWEAASASTILTLIERRAFADLTYPLSNSTIMTRRNISNFALRYFQPRRWGYMRHPEKHVQARGPSVPWRSLCQLVFRCVSIDDLSSAPTSSNLTPLVRAITYNWDECVAARTWRQIARGMLRSWLQDLQIAGVNLQTYGDSEQSMLLPRVELPWKMTLPSYHPCYTPRVARIVSGPEPKDWILEWDYFEPRYARDFWELVEWELPPLPGSWVDT